MPRTLLQQQSDILGLIAQEETTYRIYTGDELNRAPFLNRDGSLPRVRQTRPTNQEIALGTLSVTTEYYKVTWVHEIGVDAEPNANATWWVSSDGGVTIRKVKWCDRELRNQGAFWWIRLKWDFN